MATAVKEAGPGAPPAETHHDRTTQIVRSCTAASAIAALAWLVLWFRGIPASRSDVGFGTCGSVANPALGPCRSALEQQAMLAGLALGGAVFLAAVAFIYAKTRRPVHDGPETWHWLLAVVVSVGIMCAWIGVVTGNIDAVFAGN